MSSMSSADVDRVVLEALREIAKGGTEGRIGGKSVRLAGPRGNDCVYMRIALAVEEKGIVDLNVDIISHARELTESLQRLSNRDLIFNNGGGATARRSYWVVMD